MEKMEFDPCAEFYEHFPSFVSPEYNIDELDEILRSTDANLSSGLSYELHSYDEPSFATFPSPPTSSNSNSENIKSECDSPTDFNPDDYMCFPSDEDGDGKSIKSENRNSPSPTNSSGSVAEKTGTKSMEVDIPSVSPPANIFQLPATILPITASPAPINLLQGTLIPVQTVPLTPVQLRDFKAPLKISPKPADTSVTTKPKTIVLSTKDFKALMQRIQSGKVNGTAMPKIIMKSSSQSTQHKNPSVLPKVLPMSSPTSNKLDRNPCKEAGYFKGIVDEKHLKKQQRMIKNRESASLSRKKKKEYVVSLETRINDLEKENTTLKGENTSLRSQLIAFAQTCQCNHNKLSEFLTSKLNGSVLAPSCHKGTNFKNRLFTSNMKKNTAVLLAMVFMVSINFGNFQTYFSQDDRIHSSAMEFDGNFRGVSGRRGLLWVDENGNWNITKTTDPIGILHNQTNPADNDDKCPVNINQTENLRLASELKRWIVVNDYLNLSTVKERPIGFKLTPDFFELKSLALPVASVMKQGVKRSRKTFFDRQALRNKKTLDNSKNSLQLFKPQIDEEYLRLFEGIKRRDDTFYVLSFNSDHILLPAAAYNKSTRPRMSLMLPAGDFSINGDIRLMQIDCEVVNTTEVQLKPEMIPLNLRSKYNMNSPSSRDILNKTGGGTVQRTARSAVKNQDKFEGIYRPYFMAPYANYQSRNNDESAEKSQPSNRSILAHMRRRIRDDDNTTFNQEGGHFLQPKHIHLH